MLAYVFNIKWGSCEIRNESLWNRRSSALPWFRRSVAGLLLRGSGFDPRTVYVGFVVVKLELGQGFLWELHFSPVSITPPVILANPRFNTTIMIRTKGRRLGTFKKQSSFGSRAAMHREVLWHCYGFRRLNTKQRYPLWQVSYFWGNLVGSQATVC
jgi:hypothetical protein